MSGLHWAEIINNLLVPLLAVVITIYLVPFLRTKAKAEPDKTKQSTLNSLADVLEAAVNAAKVNVVQTQATASDTASGRDKKQAAIKATNEQLTQLGVDTSKLDLGAIVEAAYSAKKDELKTNYAAQNSQVEPEKQAVTVETPKETEPATGITTKIDPTLPQPLNK